VDLDSPIPQITLSKYHYDFDLKIWTKLPVVSEHWGFYFPLCQQEQFKIEEGDRYFKSTPRHAKVKENYWGLEEVIFKKMHLVTVDTSHSIKTHIFSELMLMIKQ
jgi:hypothetical protein